MEDALADEFRSLVTAPAQEIDLARAALLVCRLAYPACDEARHLGELDRLGVLAEERAGGLPVPEAAAAVARFLFAEIGFRGDEEEYYDPRNSYLSDVLERRRGIPITLSILLMEVGRRAGVIFEGVGFPGHFIVKVVGEGREVFFDPFSAGREVSVDELAGRLSVRSHQRLAQHLAAVTKRQMLIRLISNLKFTYLEAKQFDLALDAVNLLLAISPWDLDQVKDRGLIAYRMQQYQRSHEDLRTYVEYRPDAQDAEWIEKLARTVSQLAHEQGAV